MSKNNFIFFSPAKLNLFLEVLNKEHNGFHNLNSLMCFCDIGDYIKLEKSSSLSLEIEGPFASNLKKFNKNENLIIKSIKALKNA
ncbi:MAG: 4-(cytidine 5'-diphospho)-2-C-methyl-D-erythritol kinase, partial [Rickettsiales bacterium]|nr:4-(cytidine 5'-diphospho)-2-C-methyl-D-erythritol kinase [Rickettsiales bacterium]